MMPYYRGRFSRSGPLWFLSISFFSLGGYLLWLMIAPPKTYGVNDPEVQGAFPPEFSSMAYFVTVDDNCPLFQSGNPFSHYHFGEAKICVTTNAMKYKPFLRSPVSTSPSVVSPSKPSVNYDWHIVLAEWRKIDGGNLREDGTASDIAEWFDALTKRGPAYDKLKQHSPLTGPWLEKLEFFRRYFRNIVDNKICDELTL